MSTRPRGREAEPPKLILAKMSMTEAAEIVFSILNIKETRKSVKLFEINNFGLSRRHDVYDGGRAALRPRRHVAFLDNPIFEKQLVSHHLLGQNYHQLCIIIKPKTKISILIFVKAIIYSRCY